VSKAYPKIDNWVCKSTQVIEHGTGKVFVNRAYTKNILNLRKKLCTGIY